LSFLQPLDDDDVLTFPEKTHKIHTPATADKSFSASLVQEFLQVFFIFYDSIIISFD